MSMRQQPTNHTRTIPAIKHKNRLRTVFNNEQNPHRTESCWCPPPSNKAKLWKNSSRNSIKIWPII